MVSYSERYNKRHGIGGTIVGVIVIVFIIVAALAGYEAASAGISASTTTSTSTVTSTVSETPVTSTVTNTLTNTATSTVTQTNTVSVSGTVTQTVTGTVTQVSTSTATSTATITSTTGTTVTTTQTTLPPPVLPAFGSSSLPTPSSPITEAGSSLVFPYFQILAANFTSHYPNVQVSTAAGGSGAGQTGVEQGTLNIGGSDPFFTTAQVAAYPTILNIPIAVSAQQVNYNFPGLSHPLNFTGNVLGGIFNGTITYWDNAAIKAINAGDAAPLTHTLIIPVHRSDSSGDTNLFTTYLSDTSPSWAKNIGAGNTVPWPSNPAAQAANGNSGMLAAVDCGTCQYTIAYIGISYEAQAVAANVQTALLQNLAGKFVAETAANIQSALNSQYTSTPPSERISLIYGPGATSYPIINFEYALVNSNQPAQQLAFDIQTILYFVTLPQYGNSAYFLTQVGFLPLPASVAQQTWAQIAQIS